MAEQKGTLLIVDDDIAVRSVVSRKMQAEGYECDMAADGTEALQRVAARSYDLVLLDMKMPGPSGIEVLPQIVAEHPDIGVVMVTAVSDTETAVEAMKLGAHDYVTKPFNLDVLAMRVDKALERKRLIDENRDFRRLQTGLV
jgi:DNA-binding NtrC family response regulator